MIMVDIWKCFSIYIINYGFIHFCLFCLNHAVCLQDLPVISIYKYIEPWVKGTRVIYFVINK